MIGFGNWTIQGRVQDASCHAPIDAYQPILAARDTAGIALV